MSIIYVWMLDDLRGLRVFELPLLLSWAGLGELLLFPCCLDGVQEPDW